MHKLIQRRRKAGLTQEQLALAIGVTGQAVSLWESGRRTPRPYYLEALARRLGCTPRALVGKAARQ